MNEKANKGGKTPHPHDTNTGETVPPGNAAPPGAPENLTGGETEVKEVILLKKMVAKDIVGRRELTYKKTFAPEDKEQKFPLPMDPRQLYVVYGFARDTKVGDSDYGPWVAFLGSFEAIRFSDGTQFNSDKLHLQDPAEGLLLAQLQRAQEIEKGAQVGFTFEVGVKPSQRWIDTDAGNSYEYTIKTHFKLDKADPLAEMRRLVRGNVPLVKALPSATK